MKSKKSKTVCEAESAFGVRPFSRSREALPSSASFARQSVYPPRGMARFTVHTGAEGNTAGSEQADEEERWLCTSWARALRGSGSCSSAAYALCSQSLNELQQQLYEQNQEPVLSALSSKRLFFWLNSARAPAIKLSVQPHLTLYLCSFITITTWSSRLLVQVWIGIFMYFLEGGAPKR